MSRPSQSTSRPLGKSTSKTHVLAPTNPASGTLSSGARRSAGAVPGIARAASTLRQSSSSSSASGSSSSGPISIGASIPAHLRSAPRIPSPLGKGTPAKQAKQSFPVRTSKTTEKHVFLPEDPQLAPLPRAPSDVNLNTLLAGRQRSPSVSSAGPSAFRPQGADDRSDAERMTKREREDANLPRLTAYSTAEGYRLKLLQAFLKREHGVGVVRVFDDCIYAVYNLPLLPGYGASTRVRSSPAVKSPGGVSMLERMTHAEDVGYEDSYFPMEPDENNEHDASEFRAPHDPSEYILSHSPPVFEPEGAIEEHMARDVDVDVERGESVSDTLVNLSDESLYRQPSELDGQHRDEQAEQHVSTEPDAATLDVIQEERQEQDSPHDQQQQQQQQQHHHVHVPGTHMSKRHPGHVEHVPSQALTPSELDEQPEGTLVYHRSPRPPPPTRRRQKAGGSSNQIAEAVFFSYGVSVFFGFTAGEERTIMGDCESAGAWQQGTEEDDWEIDEFHYVYDNEAESPRIYNDMFTFTSRSHLFKLSLAHAIAQSTKLSIYEARLQESLELTSSFPKELSTTGHLQLTRIEALKMTGRLFKLRMDVNLIGGVLDTPELFWSEASLYPLYEAIEQYLEIGPRVQVLNDRVSVVGDLLEVIHEYIDQHAMHRITWVIIWLILVACFVEVGELIARFVFHSIMRDKGEFLIVRGVRSVLGVQRRMA